MSVRFLQIEPTTRCNFTCGFCCGRRMPQEDLDFEVFERALDTFESLEHVELQGEGESILHPRFADMIDTLRARGIKVSFITNGSLLKPSVVSHLLQAGVDKISVSIESPDAECFQQIRGGKLSKVLHNLEHLMAEKQRLGLDRPVVGLSITVLQSTRHQLDELLALYDRLGLDGGVTLQPLQEMDVYSQHYDPDVAAEGLDPKQSEAVWISFFSHAGLRRVQANKSAVGGFYEELMEGWRPAKRTCPYLEQGMYVHRDGEVTACCMVKDTANHGFGRVGAHDEAALVAGRDRMRRELAAGRIPEACEGCAVAGFATMSMPGLMAFGMRGLWLRVFGATLGGGRRG